MNFSQRMGLEITKKVLQLGFMDKELRQGLYNSIILFEKDMLKRYQLSDVQLESIYKYIWTMFLYWDVDEFSSYMFENMPRLKDYFFSCEWHKVYDFIESYLYYLDLHDSKCSNNLQEFLNYVLEKHNSAYRLVEGKFIPITGEQELAEVAEAANTGQNAIDNHMKSAISIFSQKETKDYANVVKEAISAVEAAVNIINGTEGDTLGAALSKIDSRKKIHQAMKSAFDKLYGYTCDKNTGIRHAMVNNPDYIPDFTDAKFMLVACSAFINYLMQRNSTE